MSEAKSKRRWLRFSLRALFVAIAVLCIWLGLTVSAARRQRQAVAAIRSSGGTVFYNDHKYGNRGRLGELNPDSAGPIAPKWLRDWIGEDYFCNAVVVVLQGLDEAALNELTKLPDLRSVSIDTSRPLTARHLQILGQLGGLRELHLMCPRIDAPAIVSLASLKRLKILRLVTSIDALLEQVGKLPAIACLRLSGNLATDSGFSHLKNLTNLDTLRLESFPISEDLLKLSKSLHN